MKKNYRIIIKLKNRVVRILKRFFLKPDFDKLSKDFFDIKAKVYDKEELEIYSEDSCKEVYNFLQDREYKKVLDIGCGTGHLLNLLSKNKKAEYIGIDISSEMIKIAKKKKIKNAKFIEANAQDLPFEDDSFDVITCSESFHHYPDSNKAIQEVYRILKKQGLYIIADKDVGNLVFFHNFYNKKFKNTGDCNFSNIKKATKLLKKNNFKVVYSNKYKNDTHYIVVGKK